MPVMLYRVLAIATMIGSPLDATPVESGHASVDWISASAAIPAGGTLETAVRIRIDDGWHIYWSNPGEGGMKTGFEAALPEGWKAEHPAFPAPAHFLTSGLGSFGYEGTVLFPLKLTAPADFDGMAELKMKVSWLSCDDDSCAPGEAEVSLSVTSGKAKATPEAAAILDAGRQLPKPAPEGLRLEVSESNGELVLSVAGANPTAPDLTEAAVFPVTPQVVDSSRVARFTRSGTGWSARVTKSEYAASPVAELELVVVPKGGAPPLKMAWRAKSH